MFETPKSRKLSKEEVEEFCYIFWDFEENYESFEHYHVIKRRWKFAQSVHALKLMGFKEKEIDDILQWIVEGGLGFGDRLENDMDVALHLPPDIIPPERYLEKEEEKKRAVQKDKEFEK